MTDSPQILLIEDDPSYASKCKEVLEKAGCSLIHRTNLSEANQDLLWGQYSFYVLDGFFPFFKDDMKPTQQGSMDYRVIAYWQEYDLNNTTLRTLVLGALLERSVMPSSIIAARMLESMNKKNYCIATSANYHGDCATLLEKYARRMNIPFYSVNELHSDSNPKADESYWIGFAADKLGGIVNLEKITKGLRPSQ